MASKSVEEGSKSHRKWVDFVSNVGRFLVKHKPRGGRKVAGKVSKSGRKVVEKWPESGRKVVEEGSAAEAVRPPK